MFTIEDYIDAECAWNILMEIEKLRKLLLQKYQYEFREIEIKQKQENCESCESLPF